MRYMKLDPKAIEPTRGTVHSAGMDLYSLDTRPVDVGETKVFRTGIAMEIPQGFFGAVFPRSGLSTREGLRLANCVGVIDSDYRGDITVPLHNDSDTLRIVKQGERIAQLVIIPYASPSLEEVDSLSMTDRGANGFGSTGK